MKMTYEELKALCDTMKNHKWTEAEIEEQRISFAYGNLKIDRPDLKIEDVRRVAEEMKEPEPQPKVNLAEKPVQTLRMRTPCICGHESNKHESQGCMVVLSAKGEKTNYCPCLATTGRQLF